MSEISITRFQPAVPAKDKVASVQPVENDLDAGHTDNPIGQKQSGQQQSGKQQSGIKQKQAARKEAPLTTDARAAENAAVSNKALQSAVSKLNDYVQTVKRDIIFDIDPLNNEPSVTVVDRGSRQVLRQFDSKEAMELAKKLETEEPITLFDIRV